ncbi:MAG: hypothetical protein Q4A75_04655 [Peptostreptococcaceae bacterium]|nr:hypothetical protein [Peptostreptococcaceae bacterium]
MRRKDRIIEIVFVSAVSVILTVLPMISLIFANVSKYIYMNMSGYFIFSVYFGLLPSIVYVMAIQLLLILSGQMDSFVSYSLILNLIHILIPSLIVKRGKAYYVKIFVSATVLTMVARSLSLFLYRSSVMGSGSVTLIDLKYLWTDAGIYFSSALVAFIFFFCLDRMTKRSERENKEVS